MTKGALYDLAFFLKKENLELAYGTAETYMKDLLLVVMERLLKKMLMQ